MAKRDQPSHKVSADKRAGGGEAGLLPPAQGRGRNDERSEDLCPFCGSEVPGEAGVRIVRGRGASMQVRRTGARKLFGDGRRKIFLEWFAATGNVSFAADKAGVARQTGSA